MEIYTGRIVARQTTEKAKDKKQIEEIVCTYACWSNWTATSCLELRHLFLVNLILISLKAYFSKHTQLYKTKWTMVNPEKKSTKKTKQSERPHISTRNLP